MADHQYWTYVAVPGSIDEQGYDNAVSEGRRAFALEQAVKALGSEYSPMSLVDVASTFEAYLKGESDAPDGD